ncbi:hypothetical protein AB6A40_004625 [Gnathostoma spinigerum]|uniref:DUF7802 domain-containing protein n=1 Tax=Gnathostoma spinigerum TaxID=75299 RepID=A0ABD6EE42_9BILA
MDYLLNTYFFYYLPFEISPETKKTIILKAIDVIRVADWACKAQDPRRLIANHTSLLVAECLFVFLGLLTFLHAYRHGGRYIFTWLGIWYLGIVNENAIHWWPSFDYVWHAQSSLTFFGMRVPLYLIFGKYNAILYTSYVISRRMYLPWWSEGSAMGLVALMMDFPYSVISVKLLWLQWHDTDPTISERSYWAPWSVYALNSCIACSFAWSLRVSRYVLLPQKYDWMLFMREFLVTLWAATLGFGIGVYTFYLVFHPIHSVLKISSAVATIILISSYVILVFVSDRNNSRPESRPHPGEKRYWFDELACSVCLLFLFYAILSVIADPANIVADGMHQPIGPCSITETVKTPTFTDIVRNKYLCVKNYDEKYFDFHCLPDQKPRMIANEPLMWYPICGTEFVNRMEYIAVVWFSSIFSVIILYQMGVRSGSTPIDSVKIYVRRRVKNAIRKDAKYRSFDSAASDEDITESNKTDTLSTLIQNESKEAMMNSQEELRSPSDGSFYHSRLPQPSNLRRVRSRKQRNRSQEPVRFTTSE